MKKERKKERERERERERKGEGGREEGRKEGKRKKDRHLAEQWSCCLWSQQRLREAWIMGQDESSVWP